MRNLERVEIDLTGYPLVDEIVRSLELSKYGLRTPRLRPAPDDPSSVQDRESGHRATTAIQNGDPAGNSLSVHGEVEWLAVPIAIPRLQVPLVAVVPLQRVTLPIEL